MLELDEYSIYCKQLEKQKKCSFFRFAFVIGNRDPYILDLLAILGCRA